MKTYDTEKTFILAKQCKNGNVVQSSEALVESGWKLYVRCALQI